MQSIQTTHASLSGIAGLRRYYGWEVNNNNKESVIFTDSPEKDLQSVLRPFETQKQTNNANNKKKRRNCYKNPWAAVALPRFQFAHT